MDDAHDADSLRQPRWVLHCDMDAFFSSVEQLTRPTLQGRPVLVGGRSGRGVVAGASYEARVLGCHSAMPMMQAQRLIIPRGVVVPSRARVYRAVSRRIFSILRRYAPLIEQISIDEAYCEPPELTHATVQEVRDYCENIRTVIRKETGLSVSFGAGWGKQYAKIGSHLAKPDGVCILSQRDLCTTIHPLSVRALWGVGPVSGTRLIHEGVTTVGGLAQLSEKEISHLLGKTVGPQLRLLAQGYDPRPVVERAVAKQISSESTYAVDIDTREEFHRAIDDNAQDAYRRLVKDGRAARTVTVKVKRTDMRIMSRSATLPHGTTDYAVLCALAHEIAPDPLTIGACRLVGVGFSGFSSLWQESLFPFTEEHPSLAEHAESWQAPLSGGQPTTEENTDEEKTPGPWRTGDDVRHPIYGHGWVQGSGHHKVSVRFETRSTGPGKSRTFWDTEADLTPADPLDSLDWPQEWCHDPREDEEETKEYPESEEDTPQPAGP